MKFLLLTIFSLGALGLSSQKPHIYPLEPKFKDAPEVLIDDDIDIKDFMLGISTKNNKKNNNLQGVQKGNIINTAQLTSDQFMYGFLNSKNEYVDEATMINGRINTNQLPRDKYTLGINVGDKSYVGTYNKNTEPTPCEIFEQDSTCQFQTLEDVLEGVWFYDYNSLGPGVLRFDSDGSYYNLLNVLLFIKSGFTNSWRILDDRLQFEVAGGAMDPDILAFDCNSIHLDARDGDSPVEFKRFSSCATESFGFDKLVYPSHLSISPNGISSIDPSLSEFCYEVEIVNDYTNTPFQSYTIEAQYITHTGKWSDRKLIREIDHSDMTINNKGRFQTNICMSLESLVDELAIADIAEINRFYFRTKIELSNGSTFSSKNSPTFASQLYNFSLDHLCLPNIWTKYDYETIHWCDSDTLRGEVWLEKRGNTYYFEDWSFGTFDKCFSMDSSGSSRMRFRMKCDIADFSGFESGYNVSWTIDSFIEDDKWVFNWALDDEYLATTTVWNNRGEPWPIRLGNKP